MWIATIHGFFSAVADTKNPGFIKVRARCEEDIRNLHAIIPDAPEPEEWAGTDYQWRILLTEEQWYTAIMYLAMDVPSYGNFKNAVKSPKHKSAYSSVWCTLLDKLQGGRMWKSQPRYGLLDRDEWLPPSSARQSAAAFMETSNGWDRMRSAMDDLDDQYLDEEGMTDEEWEALMREVS